MSSTLSPGGYVRQGQRGVISPRSVNVQVAVRCRPLNERESHVGEKTILKCDENRREVIFSPTSGARKNGTSLSSSSANSSHKTFTYDHVFGPRASQADVYGRVVKPIVDEVLEGYNCTVFAYGQTGTGKTHTMEGRRSTDMVEVSERRLEENAGIIPRAVEHVFEYLRSLSEEHSVRVSHLELYNEQLTDLLGSEDFAAEGLRVYEDPQKGTFVQGLEEIVVHSEEEIFSILDKSAVKRKTAETLMNKYSSRSHSIFSITIHIRESTPEGADLLKVGKLNLVDLAGSENVGRSGAVKGRAREAGNINQSLLTLGRVITALVDRHPHIPYRDSKLTRLLQESLGGRNKTCVIATVTPGSNSFEETLSTLDYAYRAKSIKNRPTVNQMIAKHELLKEYTEELAKLKKELDANREKNGVFLPLEEFERMQSELKEHQRQNESHEKQAEESVKIKEELTQKLEATQKRLAINQKELAGTKDELKVTKNHLDETQEELKITKQQRDENGALVTAHVAAESSLANEATDLQNSFVASTADIEALQTRLDIRRGCDETNQDSMKDLKANVHATVQDLRDKMNVHQNQQQSLIDISQNNMDTVIDDLSNEFRQVQGQLTSLHTRIAENSKENVVQASNRQETFVAGLEKSHASVASKTLENLKHIEQMKSNVDNACAYISKLSENSKQSMDNIKILLDKQNEQVSEHVSNLCSKHNSLLEQAQEDIEARIESQKQQVNNMIKYNETQAQNRSELLQNVRTSIIEQVTSSMASLLAQNTEHEQNRIAGEKNLMQNFVSESDELHTSVVNTREALTSETTNLVNTIDATTADLHTAFVNEQDAHNTACDQIAEKSGVVSTGIKAVVDKSTSAQKTITVDLQAASTQCDEFVQAQKQQLDTNEQKLSSSIEQCEKVLADSTEETKRATKSNLDNAKTQLSLLTTENTELLSALHTGIHSDIDEKITSFDLRVDDDDHLAPARRQWQPVRPLTRTPAHSAIIADFRQRRGLDAVAPAQFEQEAALKDENEEQQAVAETEDSECTKENPVDGVAVKGNGAEESDVDQVRKGITPSNSHEALDEIPKSEIVFADTTNRRVRKTKRKLDTTATRIRKAKPSGIPMRRSRSTKHIGS